MLTLCTQVCRDLYVAASTNSLPPDETVKLLVEVLYKLPDLGDALLRTVGLVNLRVGIYIDCLHYSLDALPVVSATRNVSGYQMCRMGQHAAAARFYRLLALFDVGDSEAAEKKDELQRLWLRIVNLLSSGTSSSNRTMVLSCLLSQKSQSMCRWFVKMLDNADLHSLISRTATTEFSSVYDHCNTTVPTSSFPQTLSIDNRGGDKSEENTIVDITGVLPSTADKTEEVISNLPSSINDDIVQVVALSSTENRHAAWYHLYLTCFERKIHFLDLFLVSNMILCIVVISDVHILYNVVYFICCVFSTAAAMDAAGAATTTTTTTAIATFSCILISLGFKIQDTILSLSFWYILILSLSCNLRYLLKRHTKQVPICLFTDWGKNTSWLKKSQRKGIALH